jgi:hypothetical protein
MTMLIASLVDGRVCPWYSEEDPIPAKFVVIPTKLREKYIKGEITDGKALAKMALAEDGSIVGTAVQNVAPPPPETPLPAGVGEDPSTVDPKKVEKGVPTSKEVTHFPKTTRA